VPASQPLFGMQTTLIEGLASFLRASSEALFFAEGSKVRVGLAAKFSAVANNLLATFADEKGEYAFCFLHV
jgi:hypothetical protein